MLSPKEVYDNRARCMEARNNIESILDIGIYMIFNNPDGISDNYEFVLNTGTGMLEYPVIERYQRLCPCDHIHHINSNNSHIDQMTDLEPIIYSDADDEEIIDCVNKNIESIINDITNTKHGSNVDYIIINNNYNIGNNIIRFGCPVCGKSFMLLPSHITHFDEKRFYLYYKDGKYAHLYRNGVYKTIHYMQIILSDIAHTRKMTIPNVTGVMYIDPNNVSIFGDHKYNDLHKKYIDQMYELDKYEFEKQKIELMSKIANSTE